MVSLDKAGSQNQRRVVLGVVIIVLGVLALFANAFVNSRPFVTSNIIGATSIAQLEMALDSVAVVWTQEMEQAVDDLHQKFGNPCP